MLHGIPVELSPPEIEAWRKTETGIPFAVTRDSGQDGPHLVICAITHGNEFAGAIALNRLLQSGFTPLKGKTTGIFMNVEAFARFHQDQPSFSRYVDEDMNRLWRLDELNAPGEQQADRANTASYERDRAREVLPILESADHILDLHSTLDAMAPVILPGKSRKAAEVAMKLGYPCWVIRDPGHASGPRLIELPQFSDPDTHKTAILIECGQHWAARTPISALEAMMHWMMHFGQVDYLVAKKFVPMTPHDPPCLVEITDVVTVEDPRSFRFARKFDSLEILPQAGTLIATENHREIRSPCDNCVVLMPTRQPYAGLTAVRLGRIVVGQPPKTMIELT